MAMGVRPESQEAALHGKRVVVTRPESDAQGLAARLRALGAEPIVAPAILIEFTDPPDLDRALAELDRFDWAIFTSKNGVQAVFRRVETLVGPRVAAVGPRTAAALREHGVEPDFVPDEYVTDAILEGLGDVRGRRILLPRADIARRALADELTDRGAELVEVKAYRTVAAPAPAEQFERIDAVTFTSSSTVVQFLERHSIPTTAKVVCIGPITAATAREHGLTVDRVATEYTEDGLIVALIDAFGDPKGRETA